MEDDWRDGQPCVVKMTYNEGHHFLTRLAKTLPKHDV